MVEELLLLVVGRPGAMVLLLLLVVLLLLLLLAVVDGYELPCEACFEHWFHQLQLKLSFSRIQLLQKL